MALRLSGGSWFLRSVYTRFPSEDLTFVGVVSGVPSRYDEHELQQVIKCFSGACVWWPYQPPVSPETPERPWWWKSSGSFFCAVCPVPFRATCLGSQSVGVWWWVSKVRSGALSDGGPQPPISRKADKTPISKSGSFSCRGPVFVWGR